MTVFLSLGASQRTPNFIVSAPSDFAARQIADSAERLRYDLAVQWLDDPLADWNEPCPITVRIGNDLRSTGKTSFIFRDGRPTEWRMLMEGPWRSLQNSVLPHEITHTILATHFGRPLPRWADEGVCVTAEPLRDQQILEDRMLHYARHKSSLDIQSVFNLQKYPREAMTLYAHGHSLVQFFLEQGSHREFIDFLEDGIQGQNWLLATERHYGYHSLSSLQREWLTWASHR